MVCDSYTGTVVNRVAAVSNSCLSINSCIFRMLVSSSSNGGAVLVSDSSKTVSIFETSFSNCSSPGYHGGAAYLKVSACSINRCCGALCSASLLHFMYQNCLSSSFSDFNQSTYYFCPRQHVQSAHSFMIHLANQRVFHDNASCNSLSGHSPGIHIDGPSSICSSYVTISNCSGEYIIILNGGDGVNSLSYYNILHNTPSSSLFYCYKSYTISHSSILFNSNNNVHYPSTGSLTFLSCNTNPLVSATFLQHEYPNGCILEAFPTPGKLIYSPLVFLFSQFCY